MCLYHVLFTHIFVDGHLGCFHFGAIKTDAETEAPILWPPDAKSQLIGKDPDAFQEEVEGRRRRG